ncbi:hypothetical protein B9Z55_025136 [Caenorhabditis nigoni]|uniref:Uncharacterized protein n=1 Tax=Caenorhabditis nigoni TaxID=1611254 RepID=A0A2G5SXM7_9PELO|nr:hypothetical protein B9Z55_025136 [Caenorhabditis nigoni]
MKLSKRLLSMAADSCQYVSNHRLVSRRAVEFCRAVITSRREIVKLSHLVCHVAHNFVFKRVSSRVVQGGKCPSVSLTCVESCLTFRLIIRILRFHFVLDIDANIERMSFNLFNLQACQVEQRRRVFFSQLDKLSRLMNLLE